MRNATNAPALDAVLRHGLGIRRWPVADWTRQYGAPGEVDDEGVVRRTCVVPRPYQTPHPPLFQPFSVSEKTIRYTAESSIVPWILVSYPPEFQRLAHVYQEVAAERGRKLALGEGIGAFRAVHFGRTEDEAVELLRTTNYAGFNHYFGGFRPEDEPGLSAPMHLLCVWRG